MANFYGGVSTQTTPILINGVSYGWSSVTVLINNVPVAGIKSLDYSSTLDAQNQYGRGSKPVSRSVANYTYTASIGLQKGEVLSLMRAAKLLNYDDVLELPFFNIQVIWQQVGSAAFHIDIIHDCQFLDVPTTLAQGEGETVITLNIIPSHITYGS